VGVPRHVPGFWRRTWNDLARGHTEVRRANDALQSYVSQLGTVIPPEMIPAGLLKLTSDVDWAVRRLR
jgi:hypothetical protein